MPDGSAVKVEVVAAIDPVPVRCVQVDNADHLYLAGPTDIPTHNSTLALDLCRAASIQNNMTSVFFSLEMTRSEITMRLLSAEAKVPLNHIRNGNMSDDDWAKLARHMGRGLGQRRCSSTTRPNMTMMEIRAKARRLKQRHDLRLVVIDYMQLMTSGKQGRVPPARGLGVLPPDQAAGQGARGPDRRALPAQPWPRAARATSGR